MERTSIKVWVVGFVGLLFVAVTPGSAYANHPSVSPNQSSGGGDDDIGLIIFGMASYVAGGFHVYDLLADKKPYVTTQVIAWLAGGISLIGGLNRALDGSSDSESVKVGVETAAIGAVSITLAILANKYAPVKKPLSAEKTTWHFIPIFIPQSDASPLLGASLTISGI
jgi:hypothetical protein